MWKGIIEEYKKFLSVTDKTPIITLQEGGTPLVHAKSISKIIGNRISVYLKCEGLNPTGSFKDRGMTLAVSKAIEEGSSVIMCASTGNTSASASAYAARAGIKCVVLIPKDSVALGKLAQALMHNAKVLAIDGNFDLCLDIVKTITSKYPITLVNSMNPYRLQGQKTGAFEVCEQLGSAPDYHIIPVGNAGNITAYWMGYKEYHKMGKIDRLPVMIGFQAEGSAPIVRGYTIKEPKTIATAIKIGNPTNWKQALRVKDESSGIISMVSDQQIIDAYRMLADREGVFAEPASAASVAGLVLLSNKGYFKENSKIVCILTGNGLKDPQCAINVIKEPTILPPVLDKITEAMGL